MQEELGEERLDGVADVVSDTIRFNTTTNVINVALMHQDIQSAEIYWGIIKDYFCCCERSETVCNQRYTNSSIRLE